ncbi:unnamed protein product [Nippostrongylus brasiliensis]|uniref:Hexosaminidase D (inferred by orthology to a human protein) n=1 Tax=Nippostrongylus brasiliensis TaxID=27835 RepID=A0A158QZC3_NIPBR|nr:unnamed protein product [Nippostrongylus brasiliensis]
MNISSAQSLGLSVIPLVQTLGHLEWILKTKEFANLRENTSYPMVACIGSDKTQNLILDAVQQMGQCEADKAILPVKYGNNTKRLVFDYIRSIAMNITETFPKTKVLMWFDEFKYVEKSLVKEYGLDRLVTPVVWKYTTDLDKDLPAKMWENLASAFSSVWGSSAFKGADGPNRYWNRMTTYLQNNKQWYLQHEKHSELFSDFHGFILTGWQR